jgi:cytochrome o ubiquinol oxidase operon protein cyoD
MSGNLGVHGVHGVHGAHDAHDPHGHAGPHAHAGSLRDYVTGFVLAVVFTAIPFWLVMNHTFSRPATTAAVILVFAAAQMVIHMVYFLHMNTRSEGGWTLLALLFTVMLVIIALSGSLWVMYHLNTNMMPAGMGDMHDMQPMHDMPNMP